MSNDFTEIENPNHVPEDRTTESIIKAVVVFLALGFFWELATQYSLLTYMFTESDSRWDFTMVMIFLPIFILPPAILLMWLKKKAGWIIAGFYIASQGAEFVISLFFLATKGYYAALPVTVGAIIIFGAAGWSMAKPSVRSVYEIDNHKMAIVTIVGVVASISYIVAQLL